MTTTETPSIGELLKPGPGRIAVQLVKGSQKYVGETGVTLWIPDISFTGRQGESNLGVVVAICDPYVNANGVQLSSDYEIGDVVVFGKYTGTEVTIGRERAVIMFDTDVLAEVVNIPTEDLPDDNAPSDAELLRAADSSLHHTAPSSGGGRPLPPGFPDLSDPRNGIIR